MVGKGWSRWFRDTHERLPIVDLTSIIVHMDVYVCGVRVIAYRAGGIVCKYIYLFVHIYINIYIYIYIYIDIYIHVFCIGI